MKRLFIADIHATLPAFEAVLTDAGQVDEIVFLGDVVGYGPHPSECLAFLRALDVKCIVGNHDLEIVDELSPEMLASDSPHACWLRWTQAQLTREQRTFLGALPPSLDLSDPDLGEIHVAHAVGTGRLYHGMSDAEIREAIRDLPGNTIICGHAHRGIDRTVDARRLVCVPGIGQCRDGDPRPGYAIQNGTEITFRYVSIDWEPIVCDVRKIGLPEPFLGRWVRFIRTGYDSEWSRTNG